MDFWLCLKVISLVSVRPKGIKLGTDSQSQRCLSCDGVNLSISSNLKLAPVPCAIPKWPIDLFHKWQPNKLFFSFNANEPFLPRSDGQSSKE